MLGAARRQRELGTDVVIGVVETHGRKETEALVTGLERLPLAELPYRGQSLREFDLDTALLRHPALILVDELAHSNAAGSRHPKRWQDVHELLEAGIDVYTTVNVQHLETLNDVVSGITGIRVWETVPDHVFDAADEVVLVDLPPDELLQRLKEGKVYLPQQAERAIQNFFRKGNLIALRELALRRTADRVDEEMLAYRREVAVDAVWHTRDALLACIGNGTGAERLVRTGARLAGRLEAPWHAIHVQIPEPRGEGDRSHQRVVRALELAESLEASTRTLTAEDPVAAIVGYAREHNLSRVLVGRDHPRPWRPWYRSMADRIGQAAPDLDVIQVARDGDSREHARPVPARPQTEDWLAYLKAAGICAVTTLLATPLAQVVEITNIAMLFLLAVLVVAVRLGRGPALAAAFLSVGAFDFFFVPPRLTFVVSDARFVLTFAVMFLVALIVGQLTARYKQHAEIAMRREARARALYVMARDLSAALMPEQVEEASVRFLHDEFGAQAQLLLSDLEDRLKPATAGSGTTTAGGFDEGVARWAFDHGEAAGLGTDTLPGSVEVAQNTLVQMESESLRNSLLSAISHDLRTPLSVLVGLAESMQLTQPPPGAEQARIAAELSAEAHRMSAQVNNLLDMARLQAGKFQLHRAWQPLEEVVGSALEATKTSLARHQVQVALPEDLPLLEFDTVLIARVLANLLENAGKYTPAGTPIRIAAEARDREVAVIVEDAGPGIPAGKEELIFQKFERGVREGATPGVGMGLAICRTIVAAHGGTIRAENRAAGGARFLFTLPRGTPPTVEPEPLSEPSKP